jgi:hypothetical protein
MRSSSLHLRAAVVAGMALLLFSMRFLEPLPTVPADFQFQSHFSRGQAELYYAKAKQELRQIYWDSIHRDLKSLQFKYAWTRLRNGPGHLEGVVTNFNADVMAFVRFRNGDNFWITVQAARDRGLAKLQ